MRIAYTSCFSATVFPDQPVWRQIKAAAPDLLILTGDSIYIDEAPVPDHPKTLADFEFLRLVAAKYRRQLAQPDFAALVASVPTAAIWDDHDFLWNEHYAEKAIKRKVYAGLIRASRAAFKAFGEHLAGLQPFPADNSDARLWRAQEPPPGYRRLEFSPPGQPPLHVHLTDGRSWRVGRTLLGAEQRAQIAAAMDAAPVDTVHLLASGSVIELHKGESWADFEDLTWLKALAGRHRIASLSGDVHAIGFNRIPVDGGRWLFDFTASGAAIRRAISVGSECQNFGLLDVDALQLRASWVQFGAPAALGPVTVDRAAWQTLP